MNGKGTELLRLKLNNFSTNAVVRTLSTELRMSLFGVEIEDLLRAKTASNDTKYLLKSFAGRAENSSSTATTKLVTITLISQMRLPENPLINTDINGSGNNKGNNNSSNNNNNKKSKGKRNRRNRRKGGRQDIHKNSEC